MKTGSELITEERKRQIEKEGWTADHDDEHNDGSLADAAACYCIDSDRYINWNTSRVQAEATIKLKRNLLWTWDEEWWKPTPNDRIRELTKAGALIAAEIDRLQRMGTKPSKSSKNNNEFVITDVSKRSELLNDFVAFCYKKNRYAQHTVPKIRVKEYIEII